MQVFGEWAQVEVIELVNDGSGLAFGIVGGRSSGVVVKSVLPGGVADRDGRLRGGDTLLRIGAVSVVGMCARQAAAVLRQCGACVRLLVARPTHADQAGITSPQQSHVASLSAAVLSRLLPSPAELERRLAEAGHAGFSALPGDEAPEPTIIEERHLMRPVASIVAVVPKGAIATPQRPAALPEPPRTPPEKLPLDMAVRGTREPETISYEVQLNKDSTLGLGITVAGYVCEQEELSGIFVKSISPGSSAHLCGQIQCNDRIVEVDGVSLNGVSNHKAVGLLRDAKGPVVRLKALRYLRGARYERLRRALAQQDTAPPSPSATSLAKYSFSVYDESTVIEAEPDSGALPHLTSPVSEEAEIVIGVNDDEAERAEVRRIQDKWRDILEKEPDWPGHDYGYDIIVASVSRQRQCGLGLSLAGWARVAAGDERGARHFLRALHPRQPAVLPRAGDELLEVNGWRVLGAHHVEVVSRLRAAASPVRLVLARPRTDRHRASAREMFGGSLQDFLSPPTRLIKAKSESSLASVCSAGTAASPDLEHDEFCSESLERNKSRSLEQMSGLAMWSDQVHYIELTKEDRGLGFSILDYSDPSCPGSSVLVVRSVVAGGAAALSSLRAGDRLLSVNGRDVARATLAEAVNAVRSAPRGIVTIGVAKPLPCSTVVGGHKSLADSLSSQDCINSLASDDHTGIDSFHECLQEYGEGLEVVQICLEPEEVSIKDDELSALGDLSDQDFRTKKIITIVDAPDDAKDMNVDNNNMIVSKSDESLDDQDDDMTITDDMLVMPRELPDTRSKSADIHDFAENTILAKENSKDISTSDEMVFAVTPTGLERVTFDTYWKDNPAKLKRLNDTPCLYAEGSVQDTSSLLYIDHDNEGYETCVDYDSSPIKTERADRKHTEHIKSESKHPPVDKDTSKAKLSQSSDDESHGRPYLQEHIIKQMQSLRIEPLNINIGKKKKRSPPKSEIKFIEYYNDQAECLEELRKKKVEEELKKTKTEEEARLKSNLKIMENKIKFRKQEPSEESTDLDMDYVPGCHKCFLEKEAITKALTKDSCKYCEVLREFLVHDTRAAEAVRRLSAPASFSLESTSETDDDGLLGVSPAYQDRRRSAEPLKFLPPRRVSYAPDMTVTVSKQRWGPPRRVALTRRPGAPLGVSIVGGKVDIISSNDSEDSDEKSVFGIFIKNVVADSPAGECRELYTGDRILEVDGVCVRSAEHERAVELIKAAGDTVSLTVQSLVAWNADSSDIEASSPAPSPTPTVEKSPARAVGTPQHEIRITVTSEGDDQGIIVKEAVIEPAKPAYSDSDSSDEEDERELGGRVYSEKGQEIDRASAGAVKRSKEEKENDPEEEDDYGYTTNKIRKKYSALGAEVVSVRVERAKGALGISLAGHRDRSRMAVFVCGVHPAGAAAAAAPPVRVGDEILEVNGVVLHGRCHLNASAIIKGLAGPAFKIILLRRKAALEDVAVKPLTQFPVALEEESETDRYAGYRGVRNVSIRKGTSSLGIMIIEGRHAEVGQGIFISDIQEGSPAEQAGLRVGDMILAVNKDSLVGIGYDAAATTLRKSEGLVVLTICNPNKKEDSSESLPADASAAEGPASRSASRNQTPEPGLKPGGGASRPQTPKPSPSKPEPVADPATAAIQPNKETVIEINTQMKSIGLMLLGGSDTKINGPAAVVLELYRGGAAAADGRLRRGDLLLECGGVPLTKEMMHERLCVTVKQSLPKIKMTVLRPEPIQYTEFEVELAKKPGKGFGLGMMPLDPPPGVFVSEVIPGGQAELDGRIQRGDLVHSIDGKDLSAADQETAAVCFKAAGPKVVIKLKRFKIVR